MFRCIYLCKAIKLYWKTIFIIIFPLITLPIFLINNKPETRCMYTIVLMAGFWVTEVLPLAITALIPMVLFPLMGILNSNKTSICYLKESNMMFVGGLIIALAVEHCNLHTRISLHVIRMVGCSYRRLNFGLVTVTMLVSMWISNTAATAMMIPIIEAVLKELEEQGLARVFEEQKEISETTMDEPPSPRPTKTTMCFYISTAYAATFGGLGCLVGSGTNMVFKGLYESTFKDSPGVEFNKWLASNIPIMLITTYISWVWMQIWFMGLFRPKSKDAAMTQIGVEGEKVIKDVLQEKLNELGPINTHEIMVALMFVLAVMLWFFRSPQFMSGWPTVTTKLRVGDSTAAMIVVLLLFTLPARLDFFYMCSSDDTKRPKSASPALVTWRFIQQKMHWSLVFLMGGGFAIAEGSEASGMGRMIAESLTTITKWPKLSIMATTCGLTLFVTQFTSSAAVANVVLPVVANISRKAKLHPMYLMMPVSLSCSFAYCLPVSTPPNAIAGAPCNMSTWEMVKIGAVISIISIAALFAVFPLLGPVIWDFEKFPEWAAF